MKKVLVILSVLALSLSADMLRVEAGAGLLSSTLSGKAQYDGDKYDISDDMGLDDRSSNLYAWAMFQHFVPILPNFRFEYSRFEASGKASKVIEWGGYAQSVDAKTKFDLKQIDIIAYYNLLDNLAWLTLDLGVDVKLLDGDFSVGTEEADVRFALPLGYARARVNLPLTGLGAETSLKYITFDGSSALDFNIKADYVFDLTALDVGIEAGYKMQRNTIDADGKVEGDLDFDGFFAGFVVKF